VWLYSVNDDDMIRLKGKAIEMNRESLWGLADDVRVHLAFDRASHRRLRDSIIGKHSLLPFRGSPPMTPHRRNDERLRTKEFALIDGRSNQSRQIGNSSAPHRQSNPLSGTKPLGNPASSKLGLNRARQVIHSGTLEPLPKAKHFGKRVHLEASYATSA
jgi:hypothetical protein